MKLEFGYGSGVQTVEVPAKNLLAVLESNPVAHEHRGEESSGYCDTTFFTQYFPLYFIGKIISFQTCWITYFKALTFIHIIIFLDNYITIYKL